MFEQSRMEDGGVCVSSVSQVELLAYAGGTLWKEDCGYSLIVK